MNDGKNFITNFRNARLSPFAQSSPKSLITRGDIQKSRRQDAPSSFINRYRAEGSMDTSENPSQENPDNFAYNTIKNSDLPSVPKAPAFKYKNRAIDNDIAYWQLFMNDDIMKNYNSLMDILDSADTLKNVDEAKDYMKRLKNTNLYKDSPSIKTWINDLESLYYYYNNKYDLSFPTAVMRYQTDRAKKEYEKGNRTK